MKDALFTWLMTCYAALASRRYWYAWNRLLFNLSLRGLGILQYPPGQGISKAEEHCLRVLAAHWDETPIILDVGAHEGEFALSVKAVCPQAHLYAFEPHPQAYAVLTSRTHGAGITTVQAACGQQAGIVTLYDYADRPGSYHASLYPTVIRDLHRGHVAGVDVSCMALDDFVAEHALSKIHLLKIDTEGHELQVLLGLSKTLARHAVDAIQFEFNGMHVMSRTWMRDFYELLEGYSFYRQVQDGLVPLGPYSPIFCELFAYQNIVALRSDGPRQVLS
jgi:FkbM family methyltransferase